MLYLIIIAILAPISLIDAGSNLDISSNVMNRSISVKGQVLCGYVPFEGAKIRLYRDYQPTDVNDLSDLISFRTTHVTGMFQLDGNNQKFPTTKTEIKPFLTIHHNCDMNEKDTAHLGYKRWAIRIPEIYVTNGPKAFQVYDIGRVNLQLEYPGEHHDKTFVFTPDSA